MGVAPEQVRAPPPPLAGCQPAHPGTWPELVALWAPEWGSSALGPQGGTSPGTCFPGPHHSLHPAGVWLCGAVGGGGCGSPRRRACGGTSGPRGQRGARTGCLCGAHALTTAPPRQRPGGRAGVLAFLLPRACSLAGWGRGPRGMAEIWHEGTRGTGMLEDSPGNQGTFVVWPLTGPHVSLHLERLLLPSNLLLPSASAPRTPPPALPQPDPALRYPHLPATPASVPNPRVIQLSQAPNSPDLGTHPRGSLLLESAQPACRGPGVAPEGTPGGPAGWGSWKPPAWLHLATAAACTRTGRNQTPCGHHRGPRAL